MKSESKTGKKVNLWIRRILERFELISGKFFIFKLRRINSDNVFISDHPFLNSNKDVAIVMQGPVIKRANFTYETIKLYRRIYPEITIILSTWINSDERILEDISRLNIDILRNEVPAFSGDSNINYQIKSTLAGLMALDGNKIKYALKTRTDQRIYTTSDYLTYMVSMLEAFPVKSKYLQKRLVVSTLNMFRKRKYTVSDMFMFGTLSDMKFFWDVPFQDVVMYEDKDKEFYENKLGEAHFIHHFFRNTGFTPEKTMEDSDMFLNRNFYIIDKNLIDIFWYKYNHNYERTNMIVDEKEDRPYSTLDWKPM
jgi:hypothetical protein